MQAGRCSGDNVYVTRYHPVILTAVSLDNPGIQTAVPLALPGEIPVLGNSRFQRPAGECVASYRNRRVIDCRTTAVCPTAHASRNEEGVFRLRRAATRC